MYILYLVNLLVMTELRIVQKLILLSNYTEKNNVPVKCFVLIELTVVWSTINIYFTLIIRESRRSSIFSISLSFFDEINVERSMTKL